MVEASKDFCLRRIRELRDKSWVPRVIVIGVRKRVGSLEDVRAVLLELEQSGNFSVGRSSQESQATSPNFKDYCCGVVVDKDVDDRRVDVRGKRYVGVKADFS